MTRILSIILTCLALTAPAVQLQFNLGNFSSQNLTNRKVLVTPLTLTNTPGIVSSYDPIYYTTTNSGYFWISNMISGTYLFEVQAPPVVSKYKLMIPGGTTNVVADSRLLTTTNSTDAQSFAYTIAAVDALFAGAGISSGIKAGTNITTITNGAEITINADVSHVEVSNATNGIKTLLEAEIVGSTNQYVRNFADTNTPTALSNILSSFVPPNVITQADTRAIIFDNTLTVSNAVTIGGGGIGAVVIADGDVIADRFIASDGGVNGPGFTGDGAGLTNGNATAFFSSGTTPTARLGSGTANSATYLRGDQTWATPSSSGSVTSGTNIYVSGGTVSVVAAPALNGANITNVTADYFSTTGQSNVTVLSSNQTELIFQNSNHYAGSFTGNGAGLTNVDTSGLVQTTRAVNTVSPLEGGGALSSDLTLTILQATASQAGALDPSNFLTFSRKWDTNGNDAGASGFLGTTNASNLRLKANGSVVMEYRTNGTVLAGAQNSDSFGVQSVILSPFGGNTNSGATNSVILGGSGNSISNATLSVIVGGGTNRIAGSDASYNGSFIGAGLRNTIQSGAGSSVIVGGVDNTISVNGVTAVIVGGEHNAVSATTGLDQQFIGGGSFNTAIGDESAIVAGSFNTSVGNASFLGGGANNLTVGTASFLGSGVLNIANGVNSVVVGGNSNTSTNSYVSIGGGYGNSASGPAATIPGGSNNIANGAYSFAAGQSASATNNGSFVWADSQSSTPYSSTNNNSFNVRAQGGAKFKADVEAAWGNTFYGNGGGLSNLNVTSQQTVTVTNLNFLGWNTNIVHVIGAGTAVANGDYYRVSNNYWTNGAVGMRGSPSSGTAGITNASGILYTNLSGGIEGLIRWTKGANGNNSPPYVYFDRRYSQTLTTNFFYGALTNISETFWLKPTLVAIVGDSRCGYFPSLGYHYTAAIQTNDTVIEGNLQLGFSYPLLKYLWTSPLIYQEINVSYGGTYAEDAITQYTNYVHSSVVGNTATNSIVIIRTGINNLSRGDTGLSIFTTMTNIAQRVVADGGIPIIITPEANSTAVFDPATAKERDNLVQYILASGYRVADSASKFQDMSSLLAAPNSIEGIHLGTNAERQVAGLIDGAMRVQNLYPFSDTPKTAATQLYPNTFYSHQVLYGTNVSLLPVIDTSLANLQLTNIGTLIVAGAGTTAANGTYTNWPAEATVLGVQVVWTNGGTGYWGVYDPAEGTVNNGPLEFYNGPNTGNSSVTYWGSTGFIPLSPSQTLNVDQAGTSPGPTLIGLPYGYSNDTFAVYDTNCVRLFSITPLGVVSGNLSGGTNLNASSLSSGTVPVARLPAGLSTSNYVGTFTGNAAASIPTNSATQGSDFTLLTINSYYTNFSQRMDLDVDVLLNSDATHVASLGLYLNTNGSGVATAWNVLRTNSDPVGIIGAQQKTFHTSMGPGWVYLVTNLDASGISSASKIVYTERAYK